ncbi:hypothetical protein GS682_06185 [Nostoc sp. B(2019)]|nr:hypothetical protein [Nostoc sp. B(2019)]
MNTHFVELPCNDCEAAPLSGIVLTMPLPMDEAIKRFNRGNVCKRDFSYTYTAGCYGDENQIWDYSHHETYEPTDPTLPSMVILRYRPRNPEAAKLFHGN